MKSCLRFAIITALWLAAIGAPFYSLFGQGNPASNDPALAAAEKEACIHNLKLIFEAIRAYQVDHKDLPNWLSDLVPQYISDTSVLTCPVCKRTGVTEVSFLADPKMPSSYLFEFCPVPLGKGEAPADPTKTRREWKRRQMGMVGSVVPMVRCRHHGQVLNLAFDGRIYESGGLWEDTLTNQIDTAELKPSRIFAESSSVSPTVIIPARDPNAKPGLINLNGFYNAGLTESWHGTSQNDLASLPSGIQNLGGVDYDIRGIIQLGAKSESSKKFPTKITGIKVRQKCEKLHFLHSIGFGGVGDEGTQVGSYIVHFNTNQMQLEIPIIYGRDARDWHMLGGEKPGPKELNVAWTGTNGVSAAAHSSIRLFTTTWVNVAPNIEIESIDFVSAQASPAPFLIAITAE